MIHRMNARFLSATLFFLSWILSAQSQFVLQIDSLPQLTPMRDTIFGVLSQTNDLAIPQTIAFQKINGKWQFNFDFQPSSDLYLSIHRGSEATVALDSVGGAPTNWNLGDVKTNNFSIKIKTWKDINRRPTVTSQVRVLDDNFFIPQLNAYRRVWILLPSDYETSQKRYPVVYMHDGQNVFDATTSFAGEWGVDEITEKLGLNSEIIIVAVDHANEKRISEYCPFNNSNENISGQGKKHSQFMAETLKPFIDKQFRTINDPDSTYIVGSSLGGLISLYTGLTYPTSFGNICALSPSIWINGQISSYIHGLKANPKSKYYLSCGTDEGEGSVFNDLVNIQNDLISIGYQSSQIEFFDDPNGNHNEEFWRSEMTRLLNIWLVKKAPKKQDSVIRVSPENITEYITIELLNNKLITMVELVDFTNTPIKAEVVDSQPFFDMNISDLPLGIYRVQVLDSENNIYEIDIEKH
jgi:predicted alpha/beta superfamily hydrolase